MSSPCQPLPTQRATGVARPVGRGCTGQRPLHTLFNHSTGGRPDSRPGGISALGGSAHKPGCPPYRTGSDLHSMQGRSACLLACWHQSGSPSSSVKWGRQKYTHTTTTITKAPTPSLRGPRLRRSTAWGTEALLGAAQRAAVQRTTRVQPWAAWVSQWLSHRPPYR